MADLGAPTAWVGTTRQDDIVKAVVQCARLRRVDAAAMTTWTDEQWQELFAAAFGATYGSVRLAVLQAVANDQE